MHAKVQVTQRQNTLFINLHHNLDKKWYTLPLTLKTYVPTNWKTVNLKQGTQQQQLRPTKDAKGSFVLYQAVPNAQTVELSGV
jgi:hypothetical protein